MAKPRAKQGLYVEVKYPPQPSQDQKDRAFTNAYKKFKKLVSNEGIIQEVRERQAYEKPSTVRNKAKAMAKKRWQKKRKEIQEERGW